MNLSDPLTLVNTSWVRPASVAKVVRTITRFIPPSTYTGRGGFFTVLYQQEGHPTFTRQRAVGETVAWIRQGVWTPWPSPPEYQVPEGL